MPIDGRSGREVAPPHHSRPLSSFSRSFLRTQKREHAQHALFTEDSAADRFLFIHSMTVWEKCEWFSFIKFEKTFIISLWCIGWSCFSQLHIIQREIPERKGTSGWYWSKKGNYHKTAEFSETSVQGTHKLRPSPPTLADGSFEMRTPARNFEMCALPPRNLRQNFARTQNLRFAPEFKFRPERLLGVEK